MRFTKFSNRKFKKEDKSQWDFSKIYKKKKSKRKHIIDLNKRTYKNICKHE